MFAGYTLVLVGFVLLAVFFAGLLLAIVVKDYRRWFYLGAAVGFLFFAVECYVGSGFWFIAGLLLMISSVGLYLLVRAADVFLWRHRFDVRKGKGTGPCYQQARSLDSQMPSRA